MGTRHVVTQAIKRIGASPHVVGVNVCRGDCQTPLPTGRLLYTERQQRKMGVRSGAYVHGDPPSALPSQVMRGRILAPSGGEASFRFGSTAVRPVSWRNR